MFRPNPMAHVEILLLQRDLAPALRDLAAARILHLQRLHGAGLEDLAGGDQLGRYRDFLGQLLRLCAELGIEVDGMPGELLKTEDLSVWESWARTLQARLGRLQRRRGELLRRRAHFAALLIFLRRLRKVPGSFADLHRWRFARLRLGLLPPSSQVELMTVTGLVAYPLGRAEGGALTAILAVGRPAENLDKRLADLPFTPVRLPDLDIPFAEALARIRSVQGRTSSSLQRINRRLVKLREENEGLIRQRLRSVRAEARLLEAGEDFAFTRRTVAIGGWVPKQRLPDLKKILRRSCGERYLLHQAPARGEETPVLLFNPQLFRPFQRMLAAFGTPSYAEVEPTPLLAIAFLLLFGMMFGDIGHGLTLVAGGGVLRRFTRFRDEGMIVAQVGIFAIFFGILFGSFFGFEELLPALWFSPMEDIPRLMTAALLLGAALIVTGLVLRICNGLRGERPAAVLTDRYGAAGLVFYAGSLGTGYLVYRGVLPAVYLSWLALPLAAIFLHPFFAREPTGIGERLAGGAFEVLETVLGYLANTLSFLRVAAFGLAHTGLLLAVFAVADEVRQLPFGMVWAILVHLAGNAIILLLEGLIVSIQALRLEFYEIFSKFFRGGGIGYRPLALEMASERRK